MKLKLFVPLAVFVFAAVLFIVGCKKDVFNKQSSHAQVPYQSSERLHELLENPDDAADEAMNDNLFMIAEGLATFSDYDTLMSIIYAKAGAAQNAAGDYEVDYTSLVSQDARFKTLLNTYLQQTYFTDKPSNYDCLYHIDSAMVYNGVDYYPNVFVPNVSIADKGMRPIICIGEAVDTNDRILGFQLDNNNELVAYYISESEAFSSTDEPIIIINNATASASNDTCSTTGDAAPNDTLEVASTGTAYVWSGWRIKGSSYRYETGNNASDIKFVITMHDNNGNYIDGSYGYDGMGEHRGHVGSISKNEATNMTWKQPSSNLNNLFPQDLSYANSLNFRFGYITIYEYDWYAQGKPVNWCDVYSTTFGISKSHWCKMKYSNEWYHDSQCFYNLLYYMPEPLYVNKQMTYKFEYKIKRVQ